ncbi:MAG: DUF4058 family protein [Armatimonadetes bacterium]|nr:DUF4058 family protein [Armatimonadota bacterium]
MPSPFPGMDPYLEAPENWHGVHQKLLAYLCDALNEYLPLPFAAVSEERCYILESEREIVPDFAIVRPFEPPTTSPQTHGTALLERITITPAEELDLEPVEVTHRFINIIAVRDRELIATIELLSPINKRGEGREKYLKKQQEILKSDIHLIEIDLLRGGEHTVAVPQKMLHQNGKPYSYLVSLSQAHRRHKAYYWPIRLEDRLPTIRIPLTPDVADIPLDLQSVLDMVYDRGAYARLVDYHHPPTPMLTPLQQKWADGYLAML